MLLLEGGGLSDGNGNGGGIHGGDEDPHTLFNRLLGNRETGVDACGAGTLS